MKFVAKLLVVLGIVALIPGGVTAYRDISQAKRHDAKARELLEERDRAREELHEVNIKYRGYQKSIPTMPDSVKKAQSGTISATYREFNKKVRSLEFSTQELGRMAMRERTKKSEVLADTWRVSGGLAGGGILLIAVGLVLSRRGAH